MFSGNTFASKDWGHTFLLFHTKRHFDFTYWIRVFESIPSSELSGHSLNVEYTYSQSGSEWNEINACYEPEMFLAKLSHEDTDDPDMSWDMVIGKGGQM